MQTDAMDASEQNNFTQAQATIRLTLSEAIYTNQLLTPCKHIQLSHVLLCARAQNSVPNLSNIGSFGCHFDVKFNSGTLTNK